MKKRVFFTAADEKNAVYAKQLEHSLRKFHAQEEIDFICYSQKDIGDPQNWYRQKPLFAKELLKEYELVLGADADQIVTGSLSYLFDKKFDVATVRNYNVQDQKKYGDISTYIIHPFAYLNAGFVALQSLTFAEHWWQVCTGQFFNALQYREQDVLNILFYFGNYKTLCLDVPTFEYAAWHGLCSKGQYHKMVLKDGKLILPKSDDNYPDRDTEIKILHSAGGHGEKKINDDYRLYFSQEVSEWITRLIQ